MQPQLVVLSVGRADVSGVDGKTMKSFRTGTLFCAQGIFVLVFFYSLSVGLLIQLVMLPFVMPTLDAGHGLLKGGDWVIFQHEAVQLANRIHHEGWAIWELRAQGNAPIGIAAATYALIGNNEPWVLLPLNAGLFAIGATCLYMMFALIAPPRLAFVATIPYVTFPSAAMIFGQIHKDVWSIAGITLIAFVWMRFAAYSMMGWKDVIMQAMLVLVGVLLIWLVRPYLLQLVIASSTLTVLALAVLTVFAHRNGFKPTPQWGAAMALSFTLPVIFAMLSTATNAFPGTDTPSITNIQETYVSNEPEKDDPYFSWNLPKWVPEFADTILSGFIEGRRSFSNDYPGAGSNIDTEVQFHSAADMARYMPRAMQIALFAPFPAMWGETGASPGATHMRLLAGIEMAFTYLVLPGTILIFIRRGRRGPAAVALAQAVVPMIVLAMVVSNVGTLYRMRYGYWQILIGLGIIGWWTWLQHWKKYRKTTD